MRFDAIGTEWVIETQHELENALQSAIDKRIEDFDKTYSRFRDDSLVVKAALSAGEYVFPEDAKYLMAFYRKLYDITGGRVTPLIGSMLEQAGYDADYSFVPREQTSLTSWDEAMQWSGNTVRTTQPIVIDIGAAGKGYSIDILAVMLEDASIHDFVIDASGDILHRGSSKHTVGLEHPFDSSKVIGTVEVENMSICASASNRRAWGQNMHHIFDPTTQKPVRNTVATWTLANEAMIADGLATALFLVEPDELMKQFDFQYVRMLADGTVDFSKDIQGKLFI